MPEFLISFKSSSSILTPLFITSPLCKKTGGFSTSSFSIFSTKSLHKSILFPKLTRIDISDSRQAFLIGDNEINEYFSFSISLGLILKVEVLETNLSRSPI